MHVWKSEGKKDKREFQGWYVKVIIWPDGWPSVKVEKKREKKSGQLWKGLCAWVGFGGSRCQ